MTLGTSFDGPRANREADARMLILGRENWPRHRPWLIATLVTSLAALVWCLADGFARSPSRWRWPAGSSLPGIVLGVAGGLIIVFEMLLWPRKAWWRGRRLGRTKHWMMAHLWLGVLVLPLLLMHGGLHFQLGRSTLAAVLMWLLVGVYASGIFGAIVQNVLPRMLLENVPAETIYSQIDHVLGQYREEADRLVRLTCGLDSVSEPAAGREREEAFVVMGAVRSVGSLQGKVLEAGVAVNQIADCEPLRLFHEAHVVPYLACESTGRGPLASPQRSSALFERLKLGLRPEAHAVVERLRALCDQRRQFDLQKRLHRGLHVWLAFHFALSAALFLLMIAHVILALKFL